MGMPVNTENRWQVAADGTIFEVLEDGTIKRIGKLSPGGKFEPFETPKNWNCPQCGRENDSENNFCGDCGTKKPETGISVVGKAVPGAKRKKCCGEFLDAGFKFCPKCGKPVDAEERDGENAVKPVDQEKTEEQIILDPDNYIDKSDYIQLLHPIGNIRMIEKICSTTHMRLEQAVQYAKNLKKGGFCDWRVPTKEELEIIYKIKDICGIKKNDEWFWSSSTLLDNSDYVYAWGMDFGNGYMDNYNIDDYSLYVRCVR